MEGNLNDIESQKKEEEKEVEEEKQTEEEKKEKEPVLLQAPELYDYKDIDNAMLTQFNSLKNTNYSTICDIIAVYLKGQKILYTESKTVCEQRLTFLMLPSIFLTVLGSILSLVLKDLWFGNFVVSAIGGVTTFLLAVVNYLKLDARAEAHKTSAYKFDKLQSYVEFSSGRLLFITCEDDSFLVEIIKKTETDVGEIKETNQFILPEYVRYMYPNLYSINVFSEVKRIQNREMMYTNQLKDIMNEKLLIDHLCNNVSDIDPKLKEKKRILEVQQKQYVNLILSLRDEYLFIDNIFKKELERNRNEENAKWCKCQYFKV
jgi:hypothetical protein